MIAKQPVLPRIYAHRGGACLAPENTQPAFDIALHYNADVLETDVQISADHRVIVIHDATVERTTDGQGKVRELTLAQLKKLDAGYRACAINGETFRGQRIRLLTLDEMLEHYPVTPINIDIKDNHPDAARLVAELLQSRNRCNDVVVCSFHPQVLSHFRQLAPEIRTAASKREVAELFLQQFPWLPTRTRSWLPPRANNHLRRHFDVVQVPLAWNKISLSTQRFIQHVRELDMELCYWTVNDSTTMRHLLSQGVDGIITDRPDLALSVFRELGLKD